MHVVNIEQSVSFFRNPRFLLPVQSNYILIHLLSRISFLHIKNHQQKFPLEVRKKTLLQIKTEFCFNPNWCVCKSLGYFASSEKKNRVNIAFIEITPVIMHTVFCDVRIFSSVFVFLVFVNIIIQPLFSQQNLKYMYTGMDTIMTIGWPFALCEYKNKTWITTMVYSKL